MNSAAFADVGFLEGEKNLSPVTGLFAIQPGTIDNTQRWHLRLRTASHAMVDARAASSVLFDGETTRLDIAFNHKIGEHLTIGVELPYIWHARGALDTFIDSWHKVFSLPEGIRDETARNQLGFRYQEDGQTVFDVTRQQHGIGDLQMTAQYQINDAQWSIAGTVKVPTGEARKLTGSGAADANLALVWQSAAAERSRWDFGASIGAAYLGESDLAFTEQTRTTWMGSASATYRVTDRLVLGARLQGHGAPLNSALSSLGDPGVMLVTGGSLRFGEHWQVRITVSEDIRVESAPDVTFRLGIARLR